MAATLGDYQKATGHFERVASQSLGSALTKYGVKEYYLKSGLCWLATAVSQTLSLSLSLTPSFEIWLKFSKSLIDWLFMVFVVSIRMSYRRKERSIITVLRIQHLRLLENVNSSIQSPTLSMQEMQNLLPGPYKNMIGTWISPSLSLSVLFRLLNFLGNSDFSLSFVG